MTDNAAAPVAHRRTMVGDEVYERTKALLMNHAIEPGDRISIDGLARDFNVSQTPVRESLARLESEGLAAKTPLRGYRAAPLLDEAQLDELFQFRLLIEPWAAGQAAARIDDAGRELLEAEFASIEAPHESNYEAYRPLAAHDLRLHRLIAELSGNAQVRAALERTNFHLHIYRLRWNYTFGPGTLAEHRRIADLIMVGDVQGAEKAMITHLESGMHGRLGGTF
ncbi:GntR family transcriptional regulator [Ruania zhangjianzhongii]|uniref:GntR family transcriptional regulator n=1 Tax=Ruania zhangjianzhongii TaxID=2603206 RepID=UPI001AEF4A81|nr:GntR family transcriptional regulator [Ruania zhangjianzhongii]